MAKLQETKKPFAMDLQLFADTKPLPENQQDQQQGGPQNQQQTQQQPAPQSLRDQAMAILAQSQGGDPSQGVAPTQGQPQSTEGNPQGEQTPNQAPAGEQPNQAPDNADALILGKFKSPEELANSYTNLEKMNTQTRQELAQAQQAAQAAEMAVEQMKQQMQGIVNPQQTQPQLTPEQQNEAFMNKFYENPTGTIQEMLKTIVEPQIQPIQQQMQAQQQQQAWNQAVGDFAQKTPDFDNWKGQMGQVLDANPNLADLARIPNGLEIAYNMAKGQNYQDPSSMLQNQDFVKQNILSNQDIKNQIIQEYLQGIQQGEKAPTVINGQANGSTVVVPEGKPQNMKDARAMAIKMLQS
ncbi:hypothetical protein [Clostridium sp. AWRP]|uniref:hypothetical protein n=1 Tax=Clostridium sp. AWRP TaxID=2212991 RepID=UPI000FD84EFE|nr:hypothetical protein [Clostridium sp. AWRP]AZV56074.1 hypothetical protein DMR38_05380 [Clostridium sp. AWRP]